MNKSISRARLVRAVLASALLVPLLLWVSGCWLFNVPPIAAFTISAQTGQAPFTVNFSAVLSDDEDGDIIQWEWDFGDGISGSGESVPHTYTTEGTFTVVLRVTDDDGESGTASKTIYISPPEPPGPVASFTASPVSGTSPLTVFVNASASSYDDGVISQYRWDWGDGSTGYGRTASRTYYSTTARDYTITLMIYATDGETGTASRTIAITVAGGGTTPAGAPSARFDIVDDAAQFAAGDTGVAPYNALFDPKDTEVAIGKTLLQIIWSFGDGSSASTQNLVTQWHRYVTTNPTEIFSVTLVAMDNDATTNAITKNVKVYNHPPVAGFEICNPLGGHTAGPGTEHYVDEAAAIAAGRWDDDDENDGVIMGDLQEIPGGAPYAVNVFIRSKRSGDVNWFPGGALGLDGSLPQDTLKMSEGLAAPGTIKPAPDDFAATNDAFSYDPEGQTWADVGGDLDTTNDYPAWFLGNQSWGIQWIYVNWGDGPEEQFDYRAETSVAAWGGGTARAPYDQDAVMMHTYTFNGGTDTKTITIRVVDFLGAEATFSRTLHFNEGTEGTDDWTL